MKTRKTTHPGLWLLMLALCVLKPAGAFADFNDDLRALFDDPADIQRASTPAPFLYEMAVHTTRESFFVPISFGQSTTLNWWSMYFEMYYSAYAPRDPKLTMTHVKRQEALDLAFSTDVVPLGLMDFDYNKFKDDALEETSNGTRYFEWDDNNVWDIAGRMDEPYAKNPGRGNTTLFEIFAFAPLWHESNFRDVDFVLDPRFIFYDASFTANILGGDVFQIDFGDGVGWRNVLDPNMPMTFHVVYPGIGDYTVKARVTRDGMMVKHSQSRFRVRNDRVRIQPDSWITSVSGLQVGVYNGCHPGISGLYKPIIYLEGIDIPENRNVPEIYDGMIRDPQLVNLRNYQYDIIVVSWRNSKQDMRNNAMNVVALLEELKCMLAPTNDNQFVVIGESMGGVVGRYALSFMETPGYIGSLVPGFNTCRDAKQSHNTRLFVTLDSPHLGAHVPIAAQHQYQALWQTAQFSLLLRTSFLIYDLISNAQFLSVNLMNQTAVRQMLIYHHSTRNLMGEYAAHADRGTFLAALNGLNPATNGWPVHCKTMVLTNGDMRGTLQTDFAGAPQNAGSRYLDLDISMSIRVLRLWDFNFFQLTDYRLNANPNGSGPLIEATVTTRRFTIIGCLRRLFRRSGPGCITTQSATLTINGNNLVDIDRMPGGTQPAGENIGSPQPVNSSLDIWVFRYEYTSGPGSISLETQIGILNPLLINFSVTSQIPEFCFIPVQSALDYGDPLLTPGRIPPLDHDLFAEPTVVKLSRSPDVNVLVGKDVGWPTAAPQSNFNFNHLFFREDVVSFPLALTWMTREIGEEVMHLDNLDIDRRALFKVEQNIFAGRNMNPYYVYPTTGPATGLINAGEAVSTDNGFLVNANGGDVFFRAGVGIRLQPGFRAELGSRFHAKIEGMVACTFVYKGSEPGGSRENGQLPVAPEAGPAYSLYPNPSNGEFNIDVPAGANPQEIAIFDLTGNMIWSQKVDANVIGIHLNPGLKPGVYSVRISEGAHVSRLMLVVQGR